MLREHRIPFFPRRCARMWLMAMLVLGAFEVCVSCGSTTSSGSSPRHDASTACDPGASRGCTGVDACGGTQRCDGDGTWGACDCRDASGTAGAGGRHPDGGSGAFAGAGAASSGGRGGASGGGGSSTGGVRPIGRDGGDASDAQKDGRAGADDPCPTTATILQGFVDCGDAPSACGPTSLGKDCNVRRCDAPVPSAPTVMSIPQAILSLSVRTPATFDASCSCSDVAHGFEFLFQNPDPTAQVRARFTISPPWRLSTASRDDHEFCNRSPGTQCVSVPDATAISLFVLTDERDPPIRNLTIDTGSCP
jgi:hypothetical protein